MGYAGRLEKGDLDAVAAELNREGALLKAGRVGFRKTVDIWYTYCVQHLLSGETDACFKSEFKGEPTWKLGEEMEKNVIDELISKLNKS